MAEYVGGEPISVGVDEPITFKNKTDTAFDVGCGIVFRKSGLYDVSIVGRRTIISKVAERKRGHWYIDERPESDREVICSNCEQPIFKYHKLDFDYRPKYCPNCGADMRGEQDENNRRLHQPQCHISD